MRVLQPVSPFAGDIAHLFNGMLILSCVIFGLVAGLIIFALLRYRRRLQARHRTLEIAWTAAPRLTVAIIPAGVRVPIWILAADVIHDFGVPELGPKIDAVPGRTNALWLEARRRGTYLGACSEYCGNQHAWMLIRVIADPPVRYAAWLAAQAAAAPRGRARTRCPRVRGPMEAGSLLALGNRGDGAVACARYLRLCAAQPLPAESGGGHLFRGRSRFLAARVLSARPGPSPPGGGGCLPGHGLPRIHRDRGGHQLRPHAALRVIRRGVTERLVHFGAHRPAARRIADVDADGYADQHGRVRS